MIAVRRSLWAKLGLALLTIAIVGPLALSGHLDGVLYAVTNGVGRMGFAGVIVFVILQFLISATGILPASLLGVAAGVAYGFLWGAPLAFLGTMAGAVASFHLGRHGVRNLPLVPGRLTRGLKQAERFIVAEGWRSVFLIRLSPVMPFAVTSIALGAAGVSKRDYLLGTAASLPALMGYVYAGSLLGRAGSLQSPQLHVVLILALALGVVAALTMAGRFVLHMNRTAVPKGD